MLKDSLFVLKKKPFIGSKLYVFKNVLKTHNLCLNEDDVVETSKFLEQKHGIYPFYANITRNGFDSYVR